MTSMEDASRKGYLDDYTELRRDHEKRRKYAPDKFRIFLASYDEGPHKFDLRDLVLKLDLEIPLIRECFGGLDGFSEIKDKQGRVTGYELVSKSRVLAALDGRKRLEKESGPQLNDNAINVLNVLELNDEPLTAMDIAAKLLEKGIKMKIGGLNSVLTGLERKGMVEVYIKPVGPKVKHFRTINKQSTTEKPETT